MAFRIECVDLDNEGNKLGRGRSELITGIQFFRHPKSNFHTAGQTIGQTQNLTIPTPFLTRSTGPTTQASSLNTPGEPTKSTRVHEPDFRHLKHRLSQLELGNDASLRGSASSNPPYFQKVLESATGAVEPHLATGVNTPGLVLESDTQQSPFRLMRLEDSAPALATQPKVGLHIVKVTKYLYPGYLWDFWLAEHSQYGPVVLKLVYTPHHPCNKPDYWDYVPEERIMDEAIREEEFYLGPLSKLQGELVPRYYGLYHSSGGHYHYAMLLEYVGRSIGPGFVMLKDEWTQKVYSAYERFHLLGMNHGDISSRHLLIDDQERIRLVGFRHSARIDLTNPSEVDVIMMEAMIIRVRIGGQLIHNVKLTSIPSSYYEKVNDRERFIESIQEKKVKKVPDWVIAIRESQAVWKKECVD